MTSVRSHSKLGMERDRSKAKRKERKKEGRKEFGKYRIRMEDCSDLI
jgi:hypothetical protein